MPDRQVLDAFVAAVVGGEHVEAILDYYHKDASMRENLAPPRVGRDALVEHERAALARVVKMITHAPWFVLAEGDDVTIGWIFDITDAGGTVRRLEEVTVQKWRGDRIAEERFFYDSATAWRSIESR